MSSKISFAFGTNQQKPKAPAAQPGPSSNMEALLAKAKAAQTVPSRPTNLFGDEDEDEGKAPLRQPPDLAGPSRTKTKPTMDARGGHNAHRVNVMSRAERRQHEEALKVDQSVFDYDGAYDKMKQAEAKLEQARKADAADKKPKYIEGFLASAQTRKLDRLRAEETKLQRERDAEGDEFADKDKFVTEAYRKQMEEVRKAEEEEKQREAELRKSAKGPGLTSLYKSMLDDQAARHDAAVAASSQPAQQAAGPSLAIRPPGPRDEQDSFDEEEEYDPLLAREAAEQLPSSYKAGLRTIHKETGREIEINDDGQVVNKRSLLKAGLNITKQPTPPTGALPNSLLTGQRSQSDDKPYVSRAVGSAASYAERMQRERKRLKEQVLEQEEKKRVEAERHAREEEEAARRRREGDGGDAARKRAEARERFLARKRQKEEDSGSRKKLKEDQ